VSADTLEQLIVELRRFTRERDWGRFHDPKNLSMLLASEAGELLQLFRWVANGEADAFAARHENRARIAEELADVAIGVLLLSDRVGLDLPAVIRAKIQQNGRKYPPTKRDA
jgi:NTP pyrophosphatase (non-canonical NTP hydrolase)